MKKKVFILFILVSFWVTAFSVRAGNASFYLSPSTGTYAVGDTFSVTVRLNSGGESINAAEGELTFDPNAILVVGISKANSIFSLWTTDPTFSNSEGKIVFGGAPQPIFPEPAELL